MVTSKSKPLAIVVGLFVSLLASAAAAEQNISFPAAVTGGNATVSMTVYENPNSGPLGATVLAVHGFTETAKAWVPLKNALFSYPQTKNRIKRLIALDLPGHGNSTPIPLLASNVFGNLTIYDNAGVIIQAIDYLRSQGLGPRVLMGHSMGGLEVQTVQETLLASGSSLAKHGVYRAILLAPVPCANITDWIPPVTTIPPQYIITDEHGTYVLLDTFAAVIGGGFSTRGAPTSNCGVVLPPGIPPVAVTPAACALLATPVQDISGAEPIATTLQLVGASPNLPRPSAREGAFALRNGTLLTVVGFSQDVLTAAEFQPELYEHLLGRQGLMYKEVVAPDAVHSMYIINPVGMLDQLFDWDNMF